MLDREKAYYEAHKTSLRERYCGKHILIIGDKVLGIYDTDRAAYQEGIKYAKPGAFMIKYIPENPAHEMVQILPRIAYAE